MPLISARNPDTLDVANIEDNDGHSPMVRNLRRCSIQNEDVVSVMTIHSAFQSPDNSNQYASASAHATSTSGSAFSHSLSTLFRREDHVMESEREHLNSDEFSVNSLPIQDSDIESIEQVWMEQQVDDVLNRSKKFSTQTYSDKGTVHSSLHRSMHHTMMQQQQHRDEDKSLATGTLGDGTLGDGSYIQNSSRTRGTARLLSVLPSSRILAALPSRVQVQANVTGQATSEKLEPVEKKQKRTLAVPSAHAHAHPHPPPPRPKISQRSSSSSVSSTKDETRSVNSQGGTNSIRSRSSSHETSASNLDKEMFRLSIELASTLANLDVSNSEIAKYRKQVVELQSMVEKLQGEKSTLRERLEGFERKKAERFERKMTVEAELAKREREHRDGPACVTPSKAGNDSSNIDDRVRRGFFSPDGNSSFGGPNHGLSRDESRMLFPELNESHISCPDLYASRVYDDVGRTIEEEDEDEFNSGYDTSVDLIDPKTEVFNGDPFATWNYSSDEGSVDEDDDDEDTIMSQALSAAQSYQSRVNTTTFTAASALTNVAQKIPLFRKKAPQSLNKSIEERVSRMQQNMANVAPSRRESLNQHSRSQMNISRIFKFRGGNDDLSVSINSHSSNNFFNFGR